MTTTQVKQTTAIITSESAYMEGKQAYYNGLDLDNNPYGEYTREFSEWYRGFEDTRFFNSDGKYVLEF